MKTLQDFTVPNDGEVPVCVVDGRVHTMNFEFANVNAFTNLVEKHPTIHITSDMLQHPSMQDEVQNLFLPVHTSFLKQISQAYYEHGLKEALNFACRSNSSVVSLVAKLALKVYELKMNLFDYDKCSYVDRQLIRMCSQSKPLNSNVRLISWNPYSTKIAVASLDDTVRIFSSDTAFVPVLKCKQQQNVTCLAWRPLSISEIAVGCEEHIIIWNVDPSSVIRPSSNNAIILHRIEHKPIISLSWSPKGDILASAATRDSNILIWNPELDQVSRLKRSGTSGNVLVRWSPVGNKLFAATNKIVFRVWDCQNWSAERWTVMSGRVQSACWLPCGMVLFFAVNEEPVIYGLTFVKSDIMFASEINDSSNTATPLFDLTKVDIDGIPVGGCVQTLDADNTGKHLAVLFQDTDCIAVFDIHTQPVLQLLANSLVTGLPDEKPISLAFQNNFSHGACLAINWSSGRIQYYPIISNKIQSLENDRTTTSFHNQSAFTSFSSPSTTYHY